MTLKPEPVCYRVHWPAIGGGFVWNMTSKPLLEKEGFKNEALYSEAQYLQGQRDALEAAAQEFDRRSVLADGSPSVGWYEPYEPAEIIRNMAKEIV